MPGQKFAISEELQSFIDLVSDDSLQNPLNELKALDAYKKNPLLLNLPVNPLNTTLVQKRLASNELNAVKFLIEKCNDDINKRDRKGITLLEKSLPVIFTEHAYKKFAIMTYLLEKGALYDEKTIEILSKKEQKIQDKFYETVSILFVKACNTGNLQEAKRLLEPLHPQDKVVLLNVRAEYESYHHQYGIHATAEETPLILAVHSGSLNLVRYLLETDLVSRLVHFCTPQYLNRGGTYFQGATTHTTNLSLKYFNC